uniref:Uncharacterized protein TCIL3000_6_2920 n=1 Tax=Trypanosoma congolense (strain IL3000) TaxID=1068625 RepID=G0UNT5_TRYCI|nr:unnamed protein product [Trypanosoma congolense IL3000]
MYHHLPSHTGPHSLSKGAQRGILKKRTENPDYERGWKGQLVASRLWRPVLANPEARMALRRNATNLSPLFDTCWTAPIVHNPKWTLSARPGRGIRVGEPTVPETLQPVDGSVQPLGNVTWVEHVTDGIDPVHESPRPFRTAALVVHPPPFFERCRPVSPSRPRRASDGAS